VEVVVAYFKVLSRNLLSRKTSVRIDVFRAKI